MAYMKIVISFWSSATLCLCWEQKIKLQYFIPKHLALRYSHFSVYGNFHIPVAILVFIFDACAVSWLKSCPCRHFFLVPAVFDHVSKHSQHQWCALTLYPSYYDHLIEVYTHAMPHQLILSWPLGENPPNHSGGSSLCYLLITWITNMILPIK